jgi:MinD-like ATPase involved in chromosome partitioning or flagellar assembly
MIYTFYSFKGGVGRSMALSNVAEFLYSRGARVLMIDWDLEAPGLESFFFGPDDKRLLDIRARLGLIDYLDQYRREYDALGAQASCKEAQQALRPLEKLLVPVRPPVVNNPTAGELWLLPAGWRASRKADKQGEDQSFDDRFPKYAAAVQDFNWNEFYTRYAGQEFFEWFRNRLLNGPPLDPDATDDGTRRGFDVVLIDSRTGVTEVGGVCTRQLADVVVSFCAPNYQNLAGAERMSESFSQPSVIEARGGRPLEIVVIPARVDEAGETDAQNLFRKQFDKTVKTPVALKESIRSCWQLLVPYVTKYAYQESLAVAVENSNEKLERAYKRLASHLALLSPPGSRLRSCLSAEIHALRGVRPRTFLLRGAGGEDMGDLSSRMAGIEIAGYVSEAASVVVSFGLSTLPADVKQQIRNARQRGACIYGLRKAGSGAGTPAILRKSAIYDSGQPLDELLDQLRFPCQSQRCPFMCPALAPGWVPRDESLQRLKNLFLGTESTTKKPVAAIRGPAGFGATTLASALCHDDDILDLFIDGILWVTPGENGDVLGCLNSIGTALTGESTKFDNIGEAATRLGQRLAGTVALLVVDDLVREEDLNPFRMLPVALLATVGQTVPVKDATEVTLDRMTHDEAVRAIGSGYSAPPSASGSGISRLAYRLAHWPLALSLAKAPLSQLTSKGMDADTAAANLASDLERGNFTAFGDFGRVLLRESRQQIESALHSLPEADRGVFHALKPLLDTPSFPIDSFPGRWTFGEQRFRSVLETLRMQGLVATDAERGTIELSAFAAQYLREQRAVPESVTTVFVLRPFGRKDGLDFDLVERELIVPALEALGISRRTTGQTPNGGNIRSAPLSFLLAADLVIADVSLPNANVFYQLGVRHALRDKRTFLIRSATVSGADSLVSFDLNTDRYLSYDGRNPAQNLHSLVGALTATLAAERPDSPVFRALPSLTPVPLSRVVTPPPQFLDDVQTAENSKSPSNLRLFSDEVRTLPWALEGLRMVGRAQFRMRSYSGAAETWEEIRRSDAVDKEANLLLGTIYQRLNDLTSSDAALQRVSGRTDLSNAEQAEALALMGRNSKVRWRAEWQDAGTGRTAEIALRSPFLAESVRQYSDAFESDPHGYYPALNALALLVIQVELAKSQPDLWADQFESDDAAHTELKRLERERSLLAAGTELALRKAERDNSDDFWVKLSRADLTLYTAARNSLITRTYLQALSRAPAFALESARNQLVLFRDLGVMTESVNAVLESFAAPTGLTGSETGTVESRTAILFAGHTVDGPGRQEPRFPPDAESAVRRRIEESVVAAKTGSTNSVGIAGASAGADIIFHEVCLDLGVPSILCLPYPPQDYVSSSVQYAGSSWVGRFYRLVKVCDPNHLRILASSPELPAWLNAPSHSSVWQRNLTWMFANGMEEGRGDLRLLALWDGRERVGFGGVSDFVHQAQARGIQTDIISMLELVSALNPV